MLDWNLNSHLLELRLISQRATGEKRLQQLITTMVSESQGLKLDLRKRPRCSAVDRGGGSPSGSGGSSLDHHDSATGHYYQLCNAADILRLCDEHMTKTDALLAAFPTTEAEMAAGPAGTGRTTTVRGGTTTTGDKSIKKRLPLEAVLRQARRERAANEKSANEAPHPADQHVLTGGGTMAGKNRSTLHGLTVHLGKRHKTSQEILANIETFGDGDETSFHSSIKDW